MAHIGIVAEHSPALGQVAAVGVVVLVVSREALVHRVKVLMVAGVTHPAVVGEVVPDKQLIVAHHALLQHLQLGTQVAMVLRHQLLVLQLIMLAAVLADMVAVSPHIHLNPVA